jgi:hypothetical protein
MKKFVVLFALISWGTIAYSQISFEKNYDGGFNDADEAWSIVQTPDGGYVMSGATWVNDDEWYNFALMKVDEYGNELWYKTYGSGMYSIEVAYSVALVSDGGFILAGGSDGFSESDDFYVVRTDGNGEVIWQKTYGGDNQEYAFSVIQTNDGGFMIAGATNSYGAGSDDFYIVKTDENGEEQWTNTFGTSALEGAYSVKQTADGGYIIAGSSNNYSDGYLVKTDANGQMEWEQMLGGGAVDEFFSVVLTDDGGYVTAGATMSSGAGDYDFWLVKFFANGDEDWERTYGGISKDKCWEVVNTNDGGYLLAGFSETYHQGDEDEGVYLVKTDANGDTLWTASHGDVLNDGAQAVVAADDGGFAAAGYQYVSGQQYNFYLVKTHPDGTVGINEMKSPKDPGMTIFPNPLHTTTTISFPNPGNHPFDLIMTDITGKVVRHLHGLNGDQTKLTRENLKPGIYLLEIRCDKILKGKIAVR